MLTKFDPEQFSEEFADEGVSGSQQGAILQICAVRAKVAQTKTTGPVRSLHLCRALHRRTADHPSVSAVTLRLSDRNDVGAFAQLVQSSQPTPASSFACAGRCSAWL